MCVRDGRDGNPVTYPQTRAIRPDAAHRSQDSGFDNVEIVAELEGRGRNGQARRRQQFIFLRVTALAEESRPPRAKRQLINKCPRIGFDSPLVGVTGSDAKPGYDDRLARGAALCAVLARKIRLRTH